MIFLTSLTIDTAYGTVHAFSIYKWDERAPLNKAQCLDFVDLISPKEIKDNFGIDIGFVPIFWGDMLMRDHIDINGIWAERVKL